MGLAWLYLRYRKLSMLQSVLETLRPAVVAMIAAAGVSIMITAFWNGPVGMDTVKMDSILIFIAALYLLKKKDMNPILVMVLSGVAKLAVQGALMILPV